MCQLLLRLFLDVLHVETQVHHTLPPACVFSLFFMLIWFVNLTWDYLCFRCLKGSKSRLIPQGFDWGTRFADRGIQSKTTSNLYAWVNLKSLYACYVFVSFITMHPPFGFRARHALLGVYLCIMFLFYIPQHVKINLTSILACEYWVETTWSNAIYLLQCLELYILRKQSTTMFCKYEIIPVLVQSVDTYCHACFVQVFLLAGIWMN
jgi:hypothetical protein